MYRCLWTPKWICETVCMLLFSHQDRNVTVCTAHSLCSVYTRVAALLAAQMTPPEIKLNYRRFSRTMIQREMKVNFDFSMLLMVKKSEALMAAHCGQGGIMAPLWCRCGFKQLLPVGAILLWDNFGKLEKLRLSDCESSPSRWSSKFNIKPGN